MDEKLRDRALSYSLLDGAFAALADSIIGGIFLTAFALKVLKAEPGQIGILASLPMLANVVQIFGSYIIEKMGHRKIFCFFTLLVSRLLWGLVVMLPLAIFAPLADWRIWILVAVVGLCGIFQSLSAVAWLAWISDLAPAKIRGTFFGKRNMISSACGMAVALLGGRFITMWSNRFSESKPYGYMILFAVGIIFGLIAAFFIMRIADIEGAGKGRGADVGFSMFLQPLRDKNFLTLTFFVAAWMFAIQIAAPFYAVFMMQNLKISISAIAVFTTFATLATLFMMKIWGPISDKLGNKPIMFISGCILIFIPFIWMIVLPQQYYIPLLIAHILTGAFTAGALLSQTNILIKLSPQQGRSAYLALYAAITGITGAVAPIIGGVLSTVLKDASFSFFVYNIGNLQIIFLVSAVLQLFAIFFILKVKEPDAATPVAVIMQLKNDLNPQTGIISTTDFVMVELQRGGNVLKQIDRVTDDIAGKSEAKIKKFLDKGENIIKKPLKRLRDFFRSEE